MSKTVQKSGAQPAVRQDSHAVYPKKIKRSVPHEHTENRPHPQTGHYDSG